MSEISPKLINIDGNRIGTEIFKGGITLISKGKYIYGNGKGLKTSNFITPDYKGRYPTQLFTNIKKDRYKYIRNINCKFNI